MHESRCKGYFFEHNDLSARATCRAMRAATRAQVYMMKAPFVAAISRRVDTTLENTFPNAVIERVTMAAHIS